MGSCSRQCVGAAVFLGLLLAVGVGIVIGYFAIPGKDDDNDGDADDSSATARFQAECKEQAELARTCTPPLPRHYVVTRKSGNLHIDGRLDDEAWSDVPWTEPLVDIRGAPAAYPLPDQDTRVKVIFDDTQLYVAARMTEPHVWATYTQKDSNIYQENAFEVFLDVDNSMAWYKEFEINALGTTWDLSLSKAYIDGGYHADWEGIGQSAVFTDGGVNDIHNTSTFWSVEVSFPFTRANQNTSRSHVTPRNGEVWFAIFARAEYQTRPNSTTGQYEKVPGTEASWWSWNPTGAVNLHLPDRWGLLMFSNQSAQEARANDVQVTFAAWPVYYGLFHVFEVMKTFKALHYMFVDDKRLLPFDPFIHTCYQSLDIQLTEDGGFHATLTARGQPELVGHIDNERHVWFT